MKFFVIFFIVVLIVGCTPDNKPAKPENLLSKDEMSSILYDIYILNAAKGINKKLLEFKGVHPERYIFDKYNIDSLQFAESNNYYAYNMDSYQDIVDGVREKIDKQKSEVKALRDNQKSIRNISLDSSQTLRKVDQKMLVPQIDSARYKRKLGN